METVAGNQDESAYNSALGSRPPFLKVRENIRRCDDALRAMRLPWSAPRVQVFSSLELAESTDGSADRNKGLRKGHIH
jgi:hypothetical protein